MRSGGNPLMQSLTAERHRASRSRRTPGVAQRSPSRDVDRDIDIVRPRLLLYIKANDPEIHYHNTLYLQVYLITYVDHNQYKY